MKTQIFIGMLLFAGMSGFSQDNISMDTADANKELVIATNGGRKMDHSLSNASFRTVTVDPDENASLLTLHPGPSPL